MSKSAIDDAFLKRFKRETETKWSKAEINRAIYGVQFQRGTRWNPGLTDAQIAEYEQAVVVEFPDDFRRFLWAMNGTDTPMLNIYSNRPIVMVYSYPSDLEAVKRQMEEVRAERNKIELELADQGFELKKEDVLVPVFGHRFIVCGSDPNESVVLSIVGTDAIVYADTLRECLEKDFLAST